MRIGFIQEIWQHEKNRHSFDTPKRHNPSIFTTRVPCGDCSGSRNVESCQEFNGLSAKRAKILVEKGVTIGAYRPVILDPNGEKRLNATLPTVKGVVIGLYMTPFGLHTKKRIAKKVTFQ